MIQDERTAAVLVQLRTEIEALVDYPPLFSETAYTPRHTTHTVIHNGVERPQGEPVAPFPGLLTACARSLVEATRLRAEVQGEAILIWRCRPMLDDHGMLYLRLCFEAR